MTGSGSGSGPGVYEADPSLLPLRDVLKGKSFRCPGCRHPVRAEFYEEPPDVIEVVKVRCGECGSVMTWPGPGYS